MSRPDVPAVAASNAATGANQGTAEQRRSAQSNATSNATAAAISSPDPLVLAASMMGPLENSYAPVADLYTPPIFAVATAIRNFSLNNLRQADDPFVDHADSDNSNEHTGCAGAVGNGTNDNGAGGSNGFNENGATNGSGGGTCTPPTNGSSSANGNALVKVESSEESGSVRKFQPRGDRTGPISPENAQAVFPPTACVFVANLSNHVGDQELASAVEEKFVQFGKVYVKIKRDHRGMPFAFAQYENDDDAEDAIVKGRGILIHGRAVRTERAKVNRSLYLHGSDGKAISETQAREILKDCGDLEKLWHASDTDMQMYHLPVGIWVTFAYYQDARDAQAAFKEHAKYHLDNYDASRGAVVRASPSFAVHRKERVTLLVHGFPASTNVNELVMLFGRNNEGYGNPVAKVELVAAYNHGRNPQMHAMVEFRGERSANEALNNEYTLRGNSLRVEKSPRALLMQSENSSGSPPLRRNVGVNSQIPPALMPYATRALAFGVQPNTVVSIFAEDGPSAMDAVTWTPGAFLAQQLSGANGANGYNGGAYANTPMYGSPVAMHPGNPAIYGGPVPMFPPVSAPYPYPMVSYYPQGDNGAGQTGTPSPSGS